MSLSFWVKSQLLALLPRFTANYKERDSIFLVTISNPILWLDMP